MDSFKYVIIGGGIAAGQERRVRWRPVHGMPSAWTTRRNRGASRTSPAAASIGHHVRQPRCPLHAGPVQQHEHEQRPGSKFVDVRCARPGSG